ncbi:hypothetical protein ACOZWC_004269 [Cronobacter turicensis]|nr:hypothetical protein [Cronobacter turicensis]ELY3838923.1 hypothetical protein [Cronobacter turicensis]
MTLQNSSNNHEELLTLCSESTLNSWSFKDQQLVVNLTTYDDDELTLIIETDIVRSSPLSSNKILNICRLVINDMHEILDVKNGYYVPPESFSDLMKHSSKYYSMYYGKKNTTRYNVAFMGNVNFLNCPIVSLEESVTWELK